MKKYQLVIIGLFSSLALFLGLILGTLMFKNEQLVLDTKCIYLPLSPKITDFQLINQDGQLFNRDSLKGKWNFLYFGYTYCPDICPLTLHVLDQVQKILARQGMIDNIAYFFISLDPERDTIEKLKDYVTYFNPKFRGITGQYEELKKFSSNMQVFYQKSSSDISNNYTIDHTSTIILISPELRPVAIFTPPQESEFIVADFIKILSAQQKQVGIMKELISIFSKKVN